MGMQILAWGAVVGILHFVVVGILYGNPPVDRLYQKAQEDDPGVRKWSSRPNYLITQFLGTQVEVYILTASYLWLRQYVPLQGVGLVLGLGLLFSGIRVYPRFWNMWIQSTYPRNLLGIEFANGVISTFTVVALLQVLPIGR